jgi:hypothetical protein
MTLAFDLSGGSRHFQSPTLRFSWEGSFRADLRFAFATTCRLARPLLEVGLVEGKHLSVDGSFVEANAAKESRIPREQFAEAAQIHQTVRQYLKEVEEQNPVEEPVHEQDQVSTTDPDSTYATKGGTPARLGYYDNYLVDNKSCVIVGVQGTAARMSQETVAGARHADPLHRVARTRAGIGDGRHDIRKRGFLAVVGGSKHHSLHANPRQHPQKEESLFRARAFHLRAGTQSLYLSRWPATELWRSSLSESRL